MSNAETAKLAEWMGWTRQIWTPPSGVRGGSTQYWRDEDGVWIWDEPDWSRIGDAWRLVERARDKGYAVQFCTLNSEHAAKGEVWEFCLWSHEPPVYTGHGDTAPAAIVAAVLAVVEG